MADIDQDDKNERGGRAKFQIEDTRARATRTALLVPIRSMRTRRAGGQNTSNEPDAFNRRGSDARREEAIGLAAAIGLNTVDVDVFQLDTLRPATLIGKGKIEALAAQIAADRIELVVIDHTLTPIQQRNLERALKAKVLDRTGLILEIFGRRAKTREGTLQVELAHLTYQRSRLVRSWTHLERQRGGKGFLGGPGETQIESDRRVLQDKITRLKRQLEDVRRTRTLHRANRQATPTPTVALIGYTNAGKSTLFNRLVDGGVLAKDQLFATLDPTLRQMTLPKGTEVIVSDTVGFVSDLPTELVAAFRATLEEVIEADILLHVRDIASDETDAQRDDVLKVLTELGIADHDGVSQRVILDVWNKVDLLPQEEAEILANRVKGATRTCLVSAHSGQGLSSLIDLIEAEISQQRQEDRFHIPVQDGEGRAWMFANATILNEDVGTDGSTNVRVTMTPRKMAHARARFTKVAAE